MSQNAGVLDSNCQLGLLESMSFRWKHNPQACALIPFDRFVTGRIPNVQEYPFPFMSLTVTGGVFRGRSDRAEWVRRTAIIHIWVDMAKLEHGEAVAEMLRRIYCNRAWRYNYGDVIDVLDNGPAQVIEVNNETFSYKELIKIMTLCIQQPRVDTCEDICVPSCSSGTNPGSSSSSHGL